MHLKNLNARTFLIALGLLLPCILVSFAFLPVSMTLPSIGPHQSIAETHVPAATDAAITERAGAVHLEGRDHSGIVAIGGIWTDPLAIWAGRH
jgi:hypothetical protein